MMTKKEKTEFDSVIEQLRVTCALRWTEPVQPDIPVPSDGKVVNGWLFNAYGPGMVEKACTSSVHHSFGNWDKTTTQQPRRLYSTKALALKALRYELELQAAKRLAAIDVFIRAESLAQTVSPNDGT